MDIYRPTIGLIKKLIKVNKLTKQFKVCFLELTLIGHWNMWLKIIFLLQYMCVPKCENKA